MDPMPRPPLLGEVASSEAMMPERFNPVIGCLQLKGWTKADLAVGLPPLFLIRYC